MSETRDIIAVQEIRDKLKPLFNDKGLQLVLLFGSAASKRAHKQSDFDFAFLSDTPADLLSLTNNVIRLMQTDAVDVIDLKRASPLLKFSAMKDGVLLYEREPGIFNTFYSLAFRIYVDTKKLRDAQTTAIHHFLHSRGLS